MHGTPIIRVLILIVALAMTAVMVQSITRDPAIAPIPTADPGSDPAPATSQAFLTVQLSAPARSLAIRSSDGQTVLVEPHAPATTEDEFRFDLPIDNNTATLLLDVLWESPAPNRFVRLLLEPDGFPTRETTVHAPADLDSHAITFTWSPNPESF